MARAIWKGEISFGLISIQVELVSAVKPNHMSFHMVDSRDGARIRYIKVNEDSGEEVPWEKIAKSYEYEEGRSVILDDDELEDIKPKLTKTFDLEEFVQLSDVSTLLFDKPYYLVPLERSQKAYVLLRETLKRQGKCAVGKVVIRTKQHAAVLFPVDDALVLNLLLFPEEIKPLSDFDFPAAEDFMDKIKDREVALSTELIESMSATWNPEKYVDESSENLRQWIAEAIDSGDTVKKKEPSKSKKKSNIVDIEELLQKSLNKSKRKSS